MIDEYAAERIALAVMQLGLVLRDETGDAVCEAAQAVLEAAEGDALAAISIAAALVHVDEPIDRWWLPTAPPIRRHGTRWGYQQHKAAGEDPCGPCELEERVYQSNRPKPAHRARQLAS